MTKMVNASLNGRNSQTYVYDSRNPKKVLEK